MMKRCIPILATVLALVLAPVLGWGLTGCDGGGTPAPETKKAADKKEELDPETKAKMAELKAKREADVRAKEEAKAKLASEIERLCIVPGDVPKDFVKACEEAGKAHDEYVRRGGDAEAIAAWDGGGSEREIPMTVVRCSQAESNEVAACQKHVLDNLGPEMKDYVEDFLQACIDKHASKTRPPTAKVPKRRPG